MEDGSVYGSSDDEFYNDEESLDGFTQVEVESDGVCQNPPSCKVYTMINSQNENLLVQPNKKVHLFVDCSTK